MKKQTQEKGRCSSKDPVVTYSSELLYHALVRSTDDFIYVCDMKTGVFHYSPQQVAEFELPGEPVVTYSSELLYHALVRSTDDFIYVCDMKTGVFHYSPQQVAEFELPGE